MARSNTKYGQFQGIQEEVDEILRGIEHTFEEMAEYEGDSQFHCIDIDEVLSQSAKARETARAAWEAKFQAIRRAEISRQFVSQNYPLFPTKAIIAPPRKLQEEVQVLFGRRRPYGGKLRQIAKTLFRRFEY